MGFKSVGVGWEIVICTLHLGVPGLESLVNTTYSASYVHIIQNASHEVAPYCVSELNIMILYSVHVLDLIRSWWLHHGKHLAWTPPMSKTQDMKLTLNHLLPTVLCSIKVVISINLLFNSNIHGNTAFQPTKIKYILQITTGWQFFMKQSLVCLSARVINPI